jgi:hypothetical protein
VRTILAFACVLLVTACGGDDDQVVPPPSGIAGVVLAGPQCPVEQAGSPCPDLPLEGVEIQVEEVGGGTTATATTDGDGYFRVDVPPGEYNVTAPPTEGAEFPAPPGDQMATVREGTITEVPIFYDTGIR